MKITRIFQVLAVVLLGVAAYFLWFGNKDGVFLALVLSGCAYFVGVRFEIKNRLKSREAIKNPNAETEAEKEAKL